MSPGLRRAIITSRANGARAKRAREKRMPKGEKKRRLMMKYKEMSLKRKRGERVTRILETGSPERLPVTTHPVGTKLTGRVISLVSHGAYLDVSGERDVLLHVRDMSDTDFIGRPDEVLQPGMDVEVWVKYNQEGNVGLTMIEGGVGANEERDGMGLDEIDVDDELWGVVSKVTSFGAFVDCGLEVLGFLHFMDHPDSPVMAGSKPKEYIEVGERVRV